MTYLLPAAFAAMLVAALLLPTTADRLRGALGLPAFVLGAASLPFLPGFRGPSVTVWISAALLLLGPAMLLVAAWRARRAAPPRTRRSSSLVLLGAGAGLAAAWPTLDSGGVFPGLVTTAAVASACLLVWMVCVGARASDAACAGSTPGSRRVPAGIPGGLRAAGRGRHGRLPGLPRLAALGPLLAADRRGPRPSSPPGGRPPPAARRWRRRARRSPPPSAPWMRCRPAGWLLLTGGAGVPDAPPRGRGGHRAPADTSRRRRCSTPRCCSRCCSPARRSALVAALATAPAAEERLALTLPGGRPILRGSILTASLANTGASS